MRCSSLFDGVNVMQITLLFSGRVSDDFIVLQLVRFVKKADRNSRDVSLIIQLAFRSIARRELGSNSENMRYDMRIICWHLSMSLTR